MRWKHFLHLRFTLALDFAWVQFSLQCTTLWHSQTSIFSYWKFLSFPNFSRHSWSNHTFVSNPVLTSNFLLQLTFLDVSLWFVWISNTLKICGINYNFLSYMRYRLLFSHIFFNKSSDLIIQLLIFLSTSLGPILHTKSEHTWCITSSEWLQ